MRIARGDRGSIRLVGGSTKQVSEEDAARVGLTSQQCSTKGIKIVRCNVRVMAVLTREGLNFWNQGMQNNDRDWRATYRLWRRGWRISNHTQGRGKVIGLYRNW